MPATASYDTGLDYSLPDNVRNKVVVCASVVTILSLLMAVVLFPYQTRGSKRARTTQRVQGQREVSKCVARHSMKK
jgi:hypothetical protein